MTLGVTSGQASTAGSGTSITSGALDTTNAKTLVGEIKWNDATQTGITFSDSAGNTGANAVIISTNPEDSAGFRSVAFYWPITVTSATHTITISWTNSAASGLVWGGITADPGNTVALDVVSATYNADVSGSNPYNCGLTGTLNFTPSMGIGYFRSQAGTPSSDTLTGNSPWAVLIDQENATTGQIALGWAALAATTSVQCNFNSLSGVTVLGITASFYEVVGASPWQPYNRWHLMGPIIAT